MRDDPQLWSGCIAGAFREDRFIQAFEDAGFHGIRIARRERQPWRVVEGIAFHSVTVLAYKPPRTLHRAGQHALLYRGPFKKVEDDSGQVFVRGRRVDVSDRTYQLLQHEPFAGHFEPIAESGADKSASCCC
jgi:hypothetical protein